MGWSLSYYSFDKFKSVTKNNKNAIISHKFQKEIKLLSESYFFIRDLINTPANILGPNEIFKEAKNFLKDFTLTKLLSGRELERNFPLISAVGKGAEKKNQPIFCEFKYKKKKSKKKDLFNWQRSFF